MPARPPASLTQQLVGLSDHIHARAQPLSVDTGAIQDDAVTAAKLNNDVYATTVTTIDPDDAAASGTVGGKLSPFDHQHAITTGTPAALTKTATPAESSGTGFARDVHVHATDVFPWGIVARQTLTSNSSGFTASATTDHSLASVVVDATRLYVVHLHTQWSLSAAGIWDINFHVDGTLTDRLDVLDEDAADNGITNSRSLWLPTTGTKTVDVRVVESAGAATLTLVGAANVSRFFWIEDIGLR